MKERKQAGEKPSGAGKSRSLYKTTFHVQELTLLHEVATATSQSLELEVMLDKVLNAIFNFEPRLAKSGAIFLCDEDTKNLKLAVSRNFSKGHAELCANVPYGECLCGLCAEKGGIVLSENSAADKRHLRSYAKEQEHIILPLEARDKMLGVFCLYLSVGIKVSERELALYKSIADIISVSLQNALNHRQLAILVRSLDNAQRIAHVGNWDWDIVNNKLRWSDEIYRIFGLTPQTFDATYEAFLNSVHPDDREFVKIFVDEALHEGKRYSIDHRIVLHDGSERIVHEQAEVTFHETGKPMQMVGTVIDITEQRKAEEKIKRAYDTQLTINKLLQLSLEDIALDALLKHTLELILSLRWLAFESRGGIFLVEDEPDVLTMKVQKGLATPLLKKCARIPFGRCLCGRAALLKEVQFADAVDGRHETSYEGIAPHGHYCVPILAGGATLGVINVCLKDRHRRDPREEEFLAAIANTLAGILIRRRITDRLIEGEKRYERLLESASGYTYTVKLENGHPISTTHGPTCVLVTGFTPEDYAADPDLWYRMIHEDDRDAVIEQSSNLLSSEDVPPVEHRIIHKDGSIRWVNNTITPHYDALGRLTAYDGIVYNITARKTAEEELVKYRDHLEELIADRTAELKTANRELLQSQAEITALLSASRSLLELKRFDDIARSIFDHCKKLIGATAGYVAFLSTDGTQNEVLFLDPGGLPCNVDPSLPMPLRGLREKAYLTGKAAYHNDFHNSEWTKYLPEGHVSIENALFVPLKVNEKAMGVLGLANKPGGFNKDDANLTGAFGELVVIAYLNNKTLESLSNSEERFRSVVQTANVAIVNVDKYGKISFWNKAAETIFGYSSYEALGKPITLIIPEQLRNDHLKRFERAISTRESRVIGKTIETTGLKKDGSEFPVELSVSKWKTSEETFFTGIMHDITELKRAEKELLTAKEMAEAANRAKSDFLASMSHELRTPMNAIIGFSQVLQGKYYGELNEKQVEYVMDILDSGNHLLSLINDILDLSKVEAGKMELELSHVDITALLKNSLLMIQEKALRHGIAVKLNIPASLEGLEIDGDERKLKQIMFNFLSNAAKFTPEGGRIGVSARLVGAQDTVVEAGTDEGPFIEICVSDTGIGIKAEEQVRIFDPFVQVQGEITGKTPGTGLGLSLTKDYAELHGGRIWVESEGPGRGSRFYVLLPTHASRLQ